MSEIDKEVLKAEIKKSLESDDEMKLQIRESLKKDLLAEIEKESLKKEILSELKPKASFWDNFFKHPAFLLIVGFILTTFLGTTLTSYWQYKTWSGQQRLATQQAIVKQKYELKDEIVKTVAETNTPAEDALASFLLDSGNSRFKTELPEKMKAWREASKNWRKNSKILKDKLIFRFDDPEIIKVFDKIIYLRAEVGGQIDGFQKKVEATKGDITNKKNPNNKEFEDAVYATNVKASEFVKLTEALMKLMVAEIKLDEIKTKPQNNSLNEMSFFKWVFD